MRFISEINDNRDTFFYGIVVGLIITLVLVWFSLPTERLTVPGNAEARQLLKFHMLADPQDSRFVQRAEHMTAEKATKQAAKYK
jgi:predicted MFS family arabinose efflux permease